MRFSLLAITCLLSFQAYSLEYKPQFENDQICMAQINIEPHEEIGLHRDVYPQVVFALKGGTITRLESDGKTTDVQFPTNVAVFRESDPENVLHKSINPSDKPVELVVVQFKNLERSLTESKQIESLLKKQLAFYEERNWAQFHSPKNLAMNLACEVGELIEPFRWLTEKQSGELDQKNLQAVQEEIGDVLMVLLHLSHTLGIDPVQAAHNKLAKMGEKYPAEQCRGKALKYTAYEK